MKERKKIFKEYIWYLAVVVLGRAGVNSHLRLLHTLQDEGVAVVHGVGGLGGDVHAVLEPRDRLDGVADVVALEGRWPAVVHHLLFGFHLHRQGSCKKRGK